MASEKEIRKKDFEAELIYLKQQIDIESSNLTEVLKDNQKVLKERLNFESEKIVFDEYKKKTEKELDVKRNEMQVQVTNHELDIVIKNDSLRKLKDDIKQATHQLAWVNEKIMKGEEEITILEKKKTDFDNLLAGLLDTQLKFDTLTLDIQDLKAKKQDLEIDCIQRLADTDFILNQKRDELKEIIDKNQTIVIERDKAQYELKTYTDSLYTAMNDYAIIRSRLETRFKQHYPELELPLMT